VSDDLEGEQPNFDIGSLLKQAQELQGKLKRMQEQAGDKVVESSSGGGMVRAVVDGLMRLRKIEIDPALLAANDKAMLEDLIVAAINDGLRRAQEIVGSEINQINPFAMLKNPGA
jgi:DNA-binding YbaB/EbfC family protein